LSWENKPRTTGLCLRHWGFIPRDVLWYGVNIKNEKMAQNTIMQKTIIEELGLQDLPQEKKDELLAKIGEVAMKRIYLETMESLEKPDQEKMVEMMDKDPDGVEAFLKEKIPNYDDFVKKVVDDFKEGLKEDMGLSAAG
jgi:hypothetical protein